MESSGGDVESSDVDAEADTPTSPDVVAQSATGASCTSNADCGTGITCQVDWPDGYCTISPCRGGITHWPGDGICDIAVDRRECLDECVSSLDCRSGYRCGLLESERRACLPTTPVGPPERGEIAGTECWGIPPGRFVEFPVAQRPEAISTTVLAAVPRGSIAPVSVRLPDGSEREFRDIWEAGYRVSRNLSQVSVPGAPHEESELATAAIFRTQDASTVCVRSTSRAESGSTLRLNVCVNTLEGVTAESAADSRAVRDLLRIAGAILQPVGVDLVTEFFHLSEADATEFQHIRDDSAAQAMVSRSFGPPVVDLLSLNVFLVESLAFGRSTLLGISMGISGPSGVHGDSSSGVIVSAGGLQSDQHSPDLIGQAFAHEVGLYLGLFHTTEQTGAHFDPLRDTPECSIESQEWAFSICPDRDNLMWPIGIVGENRNLTRHQNWVLGRNPLVRTENADDPPREMCAAPGDEDGDGLHECNDPDCFDDEACEQGSP